jgi:hypothetical protein
MVESTQGDGLNRPLLYAKFRDDKAAKPGHTLELISADVKKEDYDKFMDKKPSHHGCDTLLQHF